MKKDELCQELLKRQGGTCAICGEPPCKKRLHIDHDHKTNKIRGLLCFRCNFAVGFFRDDPDVMFAAAEYVSEEKWDAQDMKELNHAWRKAHPEIQEPPS